MGEHTEVGSSTRVQIVQGLWGNTQHANELPTTLLLKVLPWCSTLLLQLQHPLVLRVELRQMTGKSQKETWAG